MTKIWLGSLIRYKCNQCGKVLQSSEEEILGVNGITSSVIKDGQEKTVHFCNTVCRKKYFHLEVNRNG